ncbi:hypothetical protein [Symbioplanes lichenis]|uniref:hypothetical protein n=1 Tax=Symbioplanes lichenis TaxID=1629072 RepID=UPI00273987C0|nr:hypothetical protein [Actinoplanes lichenis]
MDMGGAGGEIPAPDLGLLFDSNAPDLQAVRTFVDRMPEQRAFDAAVLGHRSRWQAQGTDVQDVVAPRDNVLVYYGVGGVGKTSLVQELEARHGAAPSPGAGEWPPLDRSFRRSMTVRIDLASEIGVDLERVLLSIRLAVAGLGRPMQAFDIAFSRYWEQVHPNESIAEFLRRDSQLSRAADAVRLSDQITEGMKDVVQALGGVSTMVSVGTKVARILTDGVRGVVARRHAVQGCRRLAPMLSANADLENLSYYPHLLAWDLAECARRADDFHVAVFLDTFEDVSHDGRRRLEQLMNRLIWLLPNVLFVVSGRNRVEWADENAAGRFWRGGPAAWPGLAGGRSLEPGQHQVGHLSARDSGRFLRRRLRRDGVPIIPGKIRERIAHDSDGYPLYLDLAVTRYLQLSATGGQPTTDDFSGGFPALVTRLLRDLDPVERLLARVTALLDSFDVPLIAAIAGLPSEAVATRLALRAFVEQDNGAPFPYAMHRLLRREIRRSDSGPDAFTEADWARYARRAFEEFGARFRAPGVVEDRATVISLLNQALRLADEFDLPVGWTSDAAYAFVGDALWEAALRPLVRLPVTTSAAALAQALQAITDRQLEGRRRTAEVLTALLDLGLLTGDGADLATYYAAEALRESGRSDESAVLLESLAARPSRVADLAAKGMTHQLRRRGKFRAALDLIRSRPRSPMWLQMSGTLFWSQAMFAEAVAAYRESRDQWRAAGRPGNAAEAAGCLAFVCGLVGVDATEVEQGRLTLRGSRQTWSRLMADLGGVLLRADGGDVTYDRFAVLGAEGDATGLTSIQAYAAFGRCFNAALSGNGVRLEAERTALATLVATDFSWLLEVAGFWAGAEPEGEPADWIGGVEAARDRWCHLVELRRSAPARDS